MARREIRVCNQRNAAQVVVRLLVEPSVQCGDTPTKLGSEAAIHHVLPHVSLAGSKRTLGRKRLYRRGAPTIPQAIGAITVGDRNSELRRLPGKRRIDAGKTQLEADQITLTLVHRNKP